MIASEKDSSETSDPGFVDDTVRKIGTAPHLVLDILHEIQNHHGYLPPQSLERVCELTDITPASISGVSTFYSQFRLKPDQRPWRGRFQFRSKMEKCSRTEIAGEISDMQRR